MSMSVPPMGGAPTGPYRPVATVSPTPAFALAQTAVAHVPTVVTRDIGAAAHRYEELQRMGRELRFRVAEREIVVDVCDLSGTVLHTIPAERALDVISGGPLP